MEGPLEHSVTVLLGSNTLQGWDKVLQKAIYALNQCPIYSAAFSKARIQESRNQRVEMEVVPLTIINNNPLAKFCLLFQ